MQRRRFCVDRQGDRKLNQKTVTQICKDMYRERANQRRWSKITTREREREE